MKTPNKSKLDEKEVIDAYDELQSLLKVANRFECSEEKIRRFLKGIGVQRIPKGSKKGELNHQYKGGVRKRKDGYSIARGSRAKPLEHRVVAEKALGRKLNTNEVVHHINCDRSDNRNENLLICTPAYHSWLHAQMRKHPYWSRFCKKPRMTK